MIQAALLTLPAPPSPLVYNYCPQAPEVDTEGFSVQSGGLQQVHSTNPFDAAFVQPVAADVDSSGSESSGSSASEGAGEDGDGTKRRGKKKLRVRIRSTAGLPLAADDPFATPVSTEGGGEEVTFGDAGDSFDVVDTSGTVGVATIPGDGADPFAAAPAAAETPTSDPFAVLGDGPAGPTAQESIEAKTDTLDPPLGTDQPSSDQGSSIAKLDSEQPTRTAIVDPTEGPAVNDEPSGVDAAVAKEVASPAQSATAARGSKTSPAASESQGDENVNGGAPTDIPQSEVNVSSETVVAGHGSKENAPSADPVWNPFGGQEANGADPASGLPSASPSLNPLDKGSAPASGAGKSPTRTSPPTTAAVGLVTSSEDQLANRSKIYQALNPMRIAAESAEDRAKREAEAVELKVGYGKILRAATAGVGPTPLGGDDLGTSAEARIAKLKQQQDASLEAEDALNPLAVSPDRPESRSSRRDSMVSIGDINELDPDFMSALEENRRQRAEEEARHAAELAQRHLEERAAEEARLAEELAVFEAIKRKELALADAAKVSPAQGYMRSIPLPVFILELTWPSLHGPLFCCLVRSQTVPALLGPPCVCRRKP